MVIENLKVQRTRAGTDEIIHNSLRLPLAERLALALTINESSFEHLAERCLVLGIDTQVIASLIDAGFIRLAPAPPENKPAPLAAAQKYGSAAYTAGYQFVREIALRVLALQPRCMNTIGVVWDLDRVSHSCDLRHVVENLRHLVPEQLGGLNRDCLMAQANAFAESSPS